ncbi:MAG: zinc ribbon domain-containing protein [Acidobacteriia bacterium]|nr:zinc ribbon domain-containing protein [Terriglobia bacterium]
MPEYCTCGVQLPPDARFCHKCGKPQREEDVPVEEKPVVVLPPPPPLEQPPLAINFHNAIAVRVALLAGALAFLISAVLGPLGLVALAAGGFFAVYLYRRRTGTRLSVANGARLGWIAGIFIFAIAILVFTIQLVAVSPAEMMNQLRVQMAKNYSVTEAQVNQVISFLQSPSGIAAIVLFSFFPITLLPALGGAVGAKLLNRN